MKWHAKCYCWSRIIHGSIYQLLILQSGLLFYLGLFMCLAVGWIPYSSNCRWLAVDSYISTAEGAGVGNYFIADHMFHHTDLLYGSYSRYSGHGGAMPEEGLPQGVHQASKIVFFAHSRYATGIWYYYRLWYYTSHMLSEETSSF